MRRRQEAVQLMLLRQSETVATGVPPGAAMRIAVRSMRLPRSRAQRKALADMKILPMRAGLTT